MSNTFALIPARGGSKGIKHKNITLLAGKPLLAYGVIAAQQSTMFDGIYVSSDDDTILAVAQSYGATAFKRDAALAQDHSPTNAMIEEFIILNQLKQNDVIVLLQPTSPLRTAQHICEAMALYRQHLDCAALKSVCVADSKYFYAFIGADPYLTPLLPEYMSIGRRQDLPSIYLPNGAIYIFSVEQFMLEKAIPKTKVVAYVMKEDDSIDIDTPDDLALAEFYFNQRVIK